MYNIGKLSFRYKKHAEEHTRNLLNKLGITTLKSTHDDYQFLVDLLNNHPDHKDKIGCGIDYFNIRNNPIGKGLQTVITRLDGSIEDFSWIYCCKFEKKNSKEKNAIADLKQAMREAITEQIKEFRNSIDDMCCNYCKIKTTDIFVYQVDHIKSFSELYKNFLKDKIPPVTFGTNKNLLTCFNETDIIFKNDWIDFHKKHATLQILCKDCNSKKSNN